MLRTARLRLRRWRAEDLAPFFEINADARAMRYMRRPLMRAESDKWVEQIEAEFERDGFGLWAVELIADGSFIGMAGLNRVPFTASFTPAVEIGWRLLPRFWGQGLAPEAAAAAMNDGFARFGLIEIVAETTASNLPSQRVMQKIGMVYDADSDFKHPAMASDHPLAPHVLYRRRSPLSQ